MRNRVGMKHRHHTYGVGGSIVAAVLLAVGASTAVHARVPQSSAPAIPRGGTVTFRDIGVPDCLDPQKTAFAASGNIAAEVMDTLVTEDARGHLRPDLALKWTFSHGGRWITFMLRRGVRFSNGDPFDARAVKFTFDRALDPATKSPAAGGFLGPVAKVQVVSKYVVRMVMKAPYRPLMTNLAFHAYEGILDPRATTRAGNDTCQNPIGTGPFKIKSVGTAFSTVTLVRNPYHNWEPPLAHNQGQAYLSSIVWQPIVSDTTAASELLAHQVDVDPAVPSAQLGRLKNQPSIKLYTHFIQGESYVGFNMSRAPFNNKAVRQAVAEALDRSSLLKAAAGGLGKLAYSVVPPTMPYYDKTSRSYAPRFNLTKARAAISAAHASGPYTLITNNVPESETAAQIIQSQLSQAGMSINIVSKPQADFLAAAGKGQFDLVLVTYDWVDPDVLYLLLHSGQPLNFTFHKNATIDKLIERGRSTLQPKRAALIYDSLQRYVDRNVIVAPLWTDASVTAVSSRVKGWHTDIEGNVIFPDLYVK